MESASQADTTGIAREISCALLISGGLDSAILLAELLGKYEAVHPLYVRSGLAWEETELGYLRLYLAALVGEKGDAARFAVPEPAPALLPPAKRAASPFSALQALQVLDLPV